MPSHDTPRRIRKEDAQLIVKTLNEKGLVNECPMCRKGPFLILDGYLAPHLSANSEEATRVIGDKYLLPSFGLVCENCGFLSIHSLRTLGLDNLFDKGDKNV